MNRVQKGRANDEGNGDANEENDGERCCREGRESDEMGLNEVGCCVMLRLNPECRRDGYFKMRRAVDVRD